MPLGLLKQIKDLLADPTGIPDAGSAAADTVRGVMQQLGDTEGARSPLWTQRSLQRRMEVLRAPFGETRAAAKRWVARSTPRSSRVRPRPPGATTASWVRRWSCCDPAWPSARARRSRAPTRSRWPA
jgi:hypothetical protein